MTELQKVLEEMRGKLRFHCQTDNGNVFVSIAEINDWASRIEAEQQRTGEPVACVCGEPMNLGIVHRTDGPCFNYTHPPADAGMVRVPVEPTPRIIADMVMNFSLQKSPSMAMIDCYRAMIAAAEKQG